MLKNKENIQQKNFYTINPYILHKNKEIIIQI
jgi:hypothetical protein